MEEGSVVGAVGYFFAWVTCKVCDRRGGVVTLFRGVSMACCAQ